MSDAPAWKRWLARWRSIWTAPPEAPRAARVPTAGGATETPTRQRRAARREQLYAVVRETMIRAGVLSGAYKFKVLTLDPEGRSHVVLLDVRRDTADLLPGGPESLEHGLQVLARDRVQLEVKALYWRWWDDAPAPQTATDKTPLPTQDEITRDEIEALRQALLDRSHSRPASARPPDFEPTRPMPRRQRHDDHPLSDTQMGDLN